MGTDYPQMPLTLLRGGFRLYTAVEGRESLLPGHLDRYPDHQLRFIKEGLLALDTTIQPLDCSSMEMIRLWQDGYDVVFAPKQEYSTLSPRWRMQLKMAPGPSAQMRKFSTACCTLAPAL